MCTELKKHGDEYSLPKLRLWARMISSNLNDDYETPLDIPAFHESEAKKCHRQSSFSNAISGAAVAFKWKHFSS